MHPPVLHVIYAGRGDAMVLECDDSSTPNKRNFILVDGGPRKYDYLGDNAPYHRYLLSACRQIMGQKNSGSVQYGLVTDKKLSDLTLGSRTFSGRTILQPNGQKLIQGLLNMMHRTVPGTSAEDEMKPWVESFFGGQDLTFGRLDGFTDHLLTLCQGAHAIPTNQDGSMEDVSSGGLDVTPYGTFHDGLSYETLNSAHAAEYKSRFFQPVTHGQAQITQFNIVDRFGQVIYAHDPRPEQPKEPLDALPNTAFKTSAGDGEEDGCEWFQLSPRINQDARLHAEFLNDEDSPGPQPVTDNNTAVFAWLLINFHNQSIQVYDKDRTFKGEVLLPSEPNESVHWHSLLGVDVSSDII
ncbi:uncharacterized protein FPRO_07181 [Fusarium proliferatum ET1]|uniref:Uncharacterized protein n=1 Tax=Fusarium proliferatum (strain ET1) TaxID=1227346 RepID=A0A1L7VA33_FUSPR|nr:uncharacterized protein FPRO_07181 [Fusarium proliferatum ET1]CZR37628.1 uncharacterized protein FPRO_07181 [Fusarium proliferatum ET1]